MQNNIPILTIPRKFGTTAIVFYLLALFLVTMLYSAYPLPWYYMLSGAVAVLLFFGSSTKLSRLWSIAYIHTDKRFEQRIFWLAFVLRLVWTLLIYYIFMQNYGNAFGFENMDASQYDAWGKDFAEGIRNGSFVKVWRDNRSWGVDAADLGYASYVGVVYWLTENSILVLRIIKCILSAFTAVLVYRIGKRNFGETVGRWAAIFCCLWPNFWYYCGCHLKEVEMVFLTTLFVEQADNMIKSRNFTAWKVIPVLLISGALFTIRVPLALVTVLALLFSIFLSSTKVVSWGKRIIIAVLAMGVIGVSMGNRIQEEAQQMYQKVASGQQKQNMEWRAQRLDAGENVNKFAKYATAAIFAPTIFSLPFPTMCSPFDGQNVQKLLHGGNFVKNILSGFLILALFSLLFSGKWREHLLPLSIMLGYVVVLVFSNFAQSERFHQPAMPMELLFAAYGLSLVVQGVPLRPGLGSRATYKRWFTMWCIIMFVAAIAWNWFKLAGRGLI